MVNKFELPTEPDGPVWDKHGDKWTRTENDGWVFEGCVYRQWGELLTGYGPISTEPKLGVGDLPKTFKEYESLPNGTIVADNFELPWTKGGDVWRRAGDRDAADSQFLAGVPRMILRLGWENQ